MMKKLFTIFFCVWSLLAGAQTDVNLSQRYLGRINYNPAAAGADPDCVRLRAFFREQWLGFDRAPSTQVINVDNYFDRYNSGAGFVFIKDAIGFSKNLNLKFSYAYHLRLNADSYVSLGLALGLIHNYSDERDFRPEQGNDPNITYAVYKETLADFDVGFEYHWRTLNVGFSIAHLTKGKNDAEITPHGYGYVNYAMNLDEDWQLTPSVFLAVNNRANMLEVSAVSEYRSKFNFGLAYRANEKLSSEALVGILGFSVSDYISLGYSYDFAIGQSSSTITSAHELVMSFRIMRKKG